MTLPVVTYPSISTDGKARGWAEPFSDEAVVRGNMSSGYPFSYMTTTFDGKTWIHTLKHVSTADMESLRMFYQTNKALEFWWQHPGVNETSTYYHVAYEETFTPQIDGDEDGDWMIIEVLEQVSTSTTLSP